MSQPGNQLRAFATTSPGLEGVLGDELVTLGMSQVRQGRAGCGFRTDRVGLERVTVSLRAAHRVLWTLGEVDAPDAERLYAAVRGLIRWQGLIPSDKTFAVDATCRDTPAFRDARFAGLKVKDAIVDAVRDASGSRPDVSVDEPDVLVRVSIARGRGVVSLDAAGKTSLHVRGYRSEAGEAPLRESLASALTSLAGWDGEAPLIDPLCGSGTILIEAALRARNLAPGLARRDYGFMRWPGFKVERHQALIQRLAQAALPRCAGPILGFDDDAVLVDVARGNAVRARVGGDVRFALADATRVQDVPARGWVVTNPPWGGRMGDYATTVALLEALRLHWATLGSYRAAVLVPDAEAARAAGLGERLITVEAGGREVILAVGRFG